MKLFVTYGNGSNLRNNFSVVTGDSIAECYERIHRVCGPRYAFAYTEADFFGQTERYDLTEVPLQPQILSHG